MSKKTLRLRENQGRTQKKCGEQHVHERNQTDTNHLWCISRKSPNRPSRADDIKSSLISILGHNVVCIETVKQTQASLSENQVQNWIANDNKHSSEKAARAHVNKS